MSSNPGGGGGESGGMSQNLQAQLNGQNSRTLEAATSMEGVSGNAVANFIGMLGSLLGLNLKSVGSTSVFANLDPTQGGLKFVNDSINKGATTFSAQGGRIAQEMGGFKWDVASIVPAEQISGAIEPMTSAGFDVAAMASSQVDISPASYGNMSPASTPMVDRGMDGMGVA